MIKYLLGATSYGGPRLLNTTRYNVARGSPRIERRPITTAITRREETEQIGQQWGVEVVVTASP